MPCARFFGTTPVRVPMDSTKPFETGDRPPERKPETPPFLPGTLLFQRYRVERELGAGGMGVVLLAKDEKLGKPVAVKMMPNLDARGVEELRREVLRGMELTHPGIVRTYYFEHEGNQAAIVMEYVKGKTLAGLAALEAGDCFDCNTIAPWVLQLCEILHYAHTEAKIVHRDLKPRNVMLTKDGRIKVADFGISANLSEALTRSTTGFDNRGTPPYMSPQQIDGMRATYLDDIYSFGATLYDLFTGKPPFFRGNMLAIYSQVREVVPPTMAARREDLGIKDKFPIPMVWEDVVARCLSKNPADRPQSIEAIRQQLEAAGALHVAEAIRPLHVGGTSGSTSLPPAPGSSAGLWVTIALVAAVGLGSGAFFALKNTGSKPGPTPAPAPVSTPIAATATPRPTTPPPESTPAIYESSTGVKFLPVPGLSIRFAQSHTRYRDWEVFARTHPEWANDPEKSQWRNPVYRDALPVGNEPDMPVVMVSWHDAVAFCQWLSATDSKRGKAVTYRLPTRDEWHAAWGTGDYPWGSAWPPPRVNGKLPANYADQAARSRFGGNFPIIPDYADGFAGLAPVGTFAPNRLGLHDLGSNVQEWSQDEGAGRRKLALGASWMTADKDLLRWKAVNEEVALDPNSQRPYLGFRCVVEIAP